MDWYKSQSVLQFKKSEQQILDEDKFRQQNLVSHEKFTSDTMKNQLSDKNVTNSYITKLTSIPIGKSTGNIQTEQKQHEEIPSSKTNTSFEVDSFQAWKTLAFVFMLNATSLGALKVHGIIFERIVKNGLINRELASWPIATATTIQNLAGPITPILTDRMSWRSVEILQTLILLLGNIGAFFNNQTYFIIDLICLGFLQGLALSIRYNMNVVINNEYFERYRTTAMGFALAGSTIGVFMLKPLVEYSIDTYDIRGAYLALAIVVCFNFIFNLQIRKPLLIDESNICLKRKLNESIKSTSVIEFSDQQMNIKSNNLPVKMGNSRMNIIGKLSDLFKNNHEIHFIWLMQTIYFYTNRSYTIFIVDYGRDIGLNINSSRDLLSFWVYGELLGRLLLGRLIDLRMLPMKSNVFFINVLLASAGFCLLVKFGSSESEMITRGSTDEISTNSKLYFWYVGIVSASIAALTSLLNMVIVPFGQEILGKSKIPWAYASCSVLTGFMLLLRPLLFGLSRDVYGSYGLIIVMISTFTMIFALGFLFIQTKGRFVERHLANDLK